MIATFKIIQYDQWKKSDIAQISPQQQGEPQTKAPSQCVESCKRIFASR